MITTSKHKRSWFQFSLKGLMLMVVVAAIPCEWLKWNAGMTTTAKPHRRFFQFSLTTLLVFVAAVCVFLSVRTNRQHK